MPEPGPPYSPGRYAGETVYVDHQELVQRAKVLPAEYAGLGMEGLVREVELRQAAYLLFLRDIPKATLEAPELRGAAIQRLHERVLWTAVRYGEPLVAAKDVTGLAAMKDAPPELRAAAERVRAGLPAGLDALPSKARRAEALHAAADRAFAEIPPG